MRTQFQYCRCGGIYTRSEQRTREGGWRQILLSCDHCLNGEYELRTAGGALIRWKQIVIRPIPVEAQHAN